MRLVARLPAFIIVYPPYMLSGRTVMDEELACFRCGESLAALSLPLSRRDCCPACAIDLHVCRMCRFFDESVPKSCREDDAEEVYEKEKANFCEWFKPSPTAFDLQRAEEAARAGSQLAALFGDGDETELPGDGLTKAADDLFK
mgnify:FL=1